MTPDELRKLAYAIKLSCRELPQGERFEVAVLAAADAWDGDIWMRDHYKAEGDAFHALNECLRRRLGIVERRLVEVEHDGDWDGLEGYVQTTMNSDAALAGEE